MKKFFSSIFLIAFLLSANFSLGFAQEVTVTGIGTDRGSALRDARRVAVEEVVGAFVDSRTLTQNYMVALDNVYVKSQGFVGKVILNVDTVENARQLLKLLKERSRLGIYVDSIGSASAGIIVS